MFVLILLISAATAASENEHTIYNSHTLEDIADFVIKKTALNGNHAAELATLKTTILKQELEIISLKKEVTILQETIHGQELQIVLLNGANMDIKRNVKEQEKQIMKMKKAITKMKETLAHKEKHDQHISTMDEEMVINVGHDKVFEQVGSDTLLREIDQANNQIPNPLHQATEFELMKKTKHDIHRKDVQSVHSLMSNKNEKSENDATTQKVKSYLFGVQKRAASAGGIAFSAYLGSAVRHIMTGHIIKCDQIFY